MEFFVRTDLYQAGVTSDGERYTAECYYVVARAADGAQWAHRKTFRGCQVGTDDEGYEHFADVREEARAAADKFLAKVQAAAVVDLTFWDEIEAAYGSEAYSDEEAVAWERGLEA